MADTLFYKALLRLPDLSEALRALQVCEDKAAFRPDGMGA
jgi:hypothetical protein